MPKKQGKLEPYEISSALHEVAHDGGPVAKALELIEVAGKRAPYLMVHALAQAAAQGHAELVKTFLAHGVELDPDSSLPVLAAAENGHAEIIRMLVEAGADPNAGKDQVSPDESQRDGRIPIFAAIREGHADAVAALIEAGADVNRVSYCQRTPLDAARARKGKTAKKIVALLEAAGAKSVSTDMLDMKGAIEANAVARVTELAKRAKKEALVEALEHACTWAEREDCVAAILEHGKKKLGNDELAVGLCWAAALERLPALRLMLDTGVPVDAKGPHGEHALLVAADRGASASIDMLLAAGADINHAAESGKTALHGAVGGWGKTGALVEKLLAAGADPTLRDRKGQTPLDRAKDKDDDDARAVLQKRAGKPRSAKAIHASVLKKLTDHVRTAAIPVFAKPSRKRKPTPEAPAGSRFGGCPGLRSGERWPACQGCDAPLAFFCQLATDELPEELHAGSPHVIQFFYCTDCEPSSSTAKDAADAVLLRAVPADELTTVGTPPKKHAPFPAKHVDHWATRDDYPSGRDVGGEKGYHLPIAIDLDERKALEVFNTAGTKCGGWPCWLQDSEYVKIGKKQLDRLVLQLDVVGRPIPYEYGDGGIGFLLCAKGDPTRLGFVWQCL